MSSHSQNMETGRLYVTMKKNEINLQGVCVDVFVHVSFHVWFVRQISILLH